MSGTIDDELSELLQSLPDTELELSELLQTIGTQMKQSKSTWKRVERRTAKELGGRRNGNTGTATADVDAGLFCIECKSWRRGPERIEAALRQAEAARRPDQVAIARVHTVGKHGGQDLAVMRWSDFLDLHGDGKATVSDLIQELLDNPRAVIDAIPTIEINSRLQGGAIVRCERLERSIDADPYRELAVAVLWRAIEDARGCGTLLSGSDKVRAIQAARRWLLDGASDLPAVFDIDHDAMLAALNLQEG